MRAVSMLCSLMLLIACSSNSSTEPAVVDVVPDSKYASSLPALGTGDRGASNQPSKEPAYSSGFVLEEEVVEKARSAGDSVAPRDADRFEAPTQNRAQQNLPPLDKTFTLQLAAFRDIDQSVEYARRYQIDEAQAGVARILSNGDVWYVLAYGVYVSRSDAELAKADLQANGVPEPWIRTIAALEALASEAKVGGY